jgi:hypothetical protein
VNGTPIKSEIERNLQYVEEIRHTISEWILRLQGLETLMKKLHPGFGRRDVGTCGQHQFPFFLVPKLTADHPTEQFHGLGRATLWPRGSSLDRSIEVFRLANPGLVFG